MSGYEVGMGDVGMVQRSHPIVTSITQLGGKAATLGAPGRSSSVPWHATSVKPTTVTLGRFNSLILRVHG
jgi:hypothetical protein